MARFCSRPNLIAGRKGWGLLADVQPNGGKQLEGGNAKGIVPQNAFDRNAVPQMTNRLVLRVESVKLPNSVVIQRELYSRTTVLGALSRLGQGFVEGTIAIDYYARPGAGICRIISVLSAGG